MRTHTASLGSPAGSNPTRQCHNGTVRSTCCRDMHWLGRRACISEEGARRGSDHAAIATTWAATATHLSPRDVRHAALMCQSTRSCPTNGRSCTQENTASQQRTKLNVRDTPCKCGIFTLAEHTPSIARLLGLWCSSGSSDAPPTSTARCQWGSAPAGRCPPDTARRPSAASPTASSWRTCHGARGRCPR